MSDISAAAASAREAARQSSGKFGHQEHAETGDVDLTTPSERFRAFSYASQALRVLDTYDDSVTFDDGTTVRVMPADARLSGRVDDQGLGEIVEDGQYTWKRPDGSFGIRRFTDLDSRAEAADSLAREITADGTRVGPASQTVAERFDAAAPELRCLSCGSGLAHDGLCDSNDCGATEWGTCETCGTRALSRNLSDDRECRDCAQETERERHEGPAAEVAAERAYEEQARQVDAPGSFWDGAEVISVYTRKDALADGVLRDKLSDGSDLNDLAKEAGIVWPVAMTAAAFEDAVRWDDEDGGFQDETGRAWDVLYMGKMALQRRMRSGGANTGPGERVPFSLRRVERGSKSERHQKVWLHLVVSANDDGSPCLTIMQPDED